jgi:endonuclease G
MPKHNGYNPAFIGRKLRVAAPKPEPELKKDLFPVRGSRPPMLHYHHYSVALSRKRRFPLYVAVNIDGSAFRNLKRDSLFESGNDEWRIDERAEGFQWGDKLYEVDKSDFDKGHMVKREDPQWGPDDHTAAEGARSTFFYTNSVPQVPELNRQEWRALEDYILKKESTPRKLKISVFTGPVLSERDPVFINPVQGEEVQIPVLFWKIVYFTSDGQALSRVAFLMGQKRLLFKREIVREKPVEGPVPREPSILMGFKDAATYQVNVAAVEHLTGLEFPPAFDPYRDARPSEIIAEAVDIGDLERFPGGGDGIGFVLKGLKLR